MTINLANINLQNWQNFTQEVNQNIQNLQNNLQTSGQQLGNYVQNTTTETIDKSKGFLENKWHISETVANDIFLTMVNTIINTFNNLLLDHPHIAQIFQIMKWGINNPIRGIIILLLVIAVIVSIIKAIMKLIETASWSILKVPFFLLKNSILATFKFWKNLQQPEKTKEKRLLEIHQRLATLHTEQQQLLAEASQLISTGNTEVIE